jgi:hypothetical protein
MRKLILAVTVLGLTAATAFTAGGALVGAPTDPAQKPQARSGGLGGPPQGGLLRGETYDRLAKGDMTGTGGGHGGHKGAMKGGKKGGQHGKQ